MNAEASVAAFFVRKFLTGQEITGRLRASDSFSKREWDNEDFLCENTT